MTNGTQKTIMGAAIVAAVAIAGYVVWNHRSANTEDNPDGTFWICQNPQCKNEFVMSERQLNAYFDKHYGERLACPKCGQKDVIRALRCPKCKRFYPMQKGDTACPFCDKRPPPPDSGQPNPDGA